ncbi:hypothetical protein LRC484719_38380 [Mycobacterium riyadhense]
MTYLKPFRRLKITGVRFQARTIEFAPEVVARYALEAKRLFPHLTVALPSELAFDNSSAIGVEGPGKHPRALNPSVSPA